MRDLVRRSVLKPVFKIERAVRLGGLTMRRVDDSAVKIEDGNIADLLKPRSLLCILYKPCDPKFQGQTVENFCFFQTIKKKILRLE